MPILSDPADKDSNSFSTVVDADVYYSEKYNADAWGILMEASKEQLLVTASRAISTAYFFKGSRTDSESRLAFPRKYLYDDDGVVVADNIYPYLLKEATYELAFKFLENSTSNASDINSSTQQLDAVKLGDLEVDYYKDISSQSSGGILAQDESTDIVAVILSPFIAGSKSGGSGFYKIVR